MQIVDATASRLQVALAVADVGDNNSTKTTTSAWFYLRILPANNSDTFNEGDKYCIISPL